MHCLLPYHHFHTSGEVLTTPASLISSHELRCATPLIATRPPSTSPDFSASGPGASSSPGAGAYTVVYEVGVAAVDAGVRSGAGVGSVSGTGTAAWAGALSGSSITPPTRCDRSGFSYTFVTLPKISQVTPTAGPAWGGTGIQIQFAVDEYVDDASYANGGGLSSLTPQMYCRLGKGAGLLGQVIGGNTLLCTTNAQPAVRLPSSYTPSCCCFHSSYPLSFSHLPTHISSAYLKPKI